MKDNVKSFRLVSGEEIVCYLDDFDNDKIYVSSPRVLQIMPTPNGLSLGLLPWFNSSQEGRIPVFKHQMVTDTISPDNEIVDAYVKQTSKIQVVTSGGILHG